MDLFCETKVHKLYMTFGINEDVLGLQIPICNAFDIMQELQNQNYFCSIEARDVLLELMGPSQVGENFASRTEVELSMVSK